MKYRIENVHVPSSGGIAQPGSANDQHRELAGRRIIHVLNSSTLAGQGWNLTVLTEEDD